MAHLYCGQLDSRSQLDIKDVISRIIDETKLFDKQIFGVPTDLIPGIDKKMESNWQVLGLDESYLEKKHQKAAQNAFEVLGKVRYYNRSAKEEVPEIRAALSRIPVNVLVSNREFKNEMYKHAYSNELKQHNQNIINVK